MAELEELECQGAPALAAEDGSAARSDAENQDPSEAGSLRKMFQEGSHQIGTHRCAPHDKRQGGGVRRCGGAQAGPSQQAGSRGFELAAAGGRLARACLLARALLSKLSTGSVLRC